MLLLWCSARSTYRYRLGLLKQLLDLVSPSIWTGRGLKLAGNMMYNTEKLHVQQFTIRCVEYDFGRLSCSWLWSINAANGLALTGYPLGRLRFLCIAHSTNDSSQSNLCSWCFLQPLVSIGHVQSLVAVGLRDTGTLT